MGTDARTPQLDTRRLRPTAKEAEAMYTRCPHCDTWFRIGAAQLAQAHGQVRCGVCAEQFNALSALSARPEHRRTGPDTTRATDIDTATPIPMATTHNTTTTHNTSGVR